MLRWLELTMRLTGVSKQLEQLVQQLEPKLQHLEHVVHPRLQQFARRDRRRGDVLRALTPSQDRELQTRGWTFLERVQASALFQVPDGRRSDKRRTKSARVLQPPSMRIFRLSSASVNSKHGFDALRAST